LSRLAALAIARPRQVLVTWLAIAGALGLLGLGVESKLHRSDLVIPGTATERSVESLNQQFGSSFDTIVLLRGPAAQIDSRGRGLVRSLDAIAGVTVLAPWMEGASASLRPRPDTALLIVRSQGSFEYVSEDLVPRVRERAARLAPPLRWHVSGYPDIASGIHGGTVAAIERAELLAAPLLLIILLLVFRSPIAAALPLLVGFTAIGSVRGVLTVVNGFYPLDALALNVASMMGLALGIDYALLMVSRFREELATGHSPRQAGANAAAAAGHTVIAAGVALAVAMVATSLVVPAGLLTGVGIGLVASVVVCVLAALTALPAALALLGGDIDRWAFGGARSRGPGGVA
jgi:RND superfamily putative drug exporter